MIRVVKKNDVNMFVECDNSIAYELSDFFAFKAPNFFFHPLYRAKRWDGTIRLFNLGVRELLIGLLPHLKEFCELRKYKIEIDPRLEDTNDITPIQVKEHINSLNPFYFDKQSDTWEKLKPRDYQLYADYYALKNKRALLISPTSSGKSLIIYSIIRYLQTVITPQKKILIIVPTTGLVTQMYNDFDEYAHNTDWSAEKYIHQIYGGQEKLTNKKIVLSTWQSIYKLQSKWFHQFEAVIGDECHEFQAKSLTSIMSKLTECPWRIGTTGTLGSKTIHKLQLEGMFGKAKKFITTSDLMARNEVANLSIKAIRIHYSDEDRKKISQQTKENKKAKYQDELEFIINHEKRTSFIANLADKQNENVLILYARNDHGKAIWKKLHEKFKDTDRNVYMVNGATAKEKRETVRQIFEKEKRSVIVASFGVFARGVSIKNIHHVIFASPSKSEFRVLQSIGRGLRISKTKDKVVLYDLVDDLSWKSRKNYCLKHFIDRMNIYAKEKFNYKIIDFKMAA